jgi:hypothetical protein
LKGPFPGQRDRARRRAASIGVSVQEVSGSSECEPGLAREVFLRTTVLQNDRFTDSEGLTQMAWQRSDEQSWSGTLFAEGQASVTFPGVEQSPVWTSTFDVRLADEEEEAEEVEDDDDDDEDEADEEFDDEELDDEEFDDEEFDDEDDDLDEDDDEEEEEEEADEDY